MAEGKRQQRQLQPVTTTMGASGVRALVDRRIIPQAQGAKVRAQGAKVRTEGATVRTSISTSRKGCSNNIQLQQPPPPPTRTNTA